jgi:hypothetical protein
MSWGRTVAVCAARLRAGGPVRYRMRFALARSVFGAVFAVALTALMPAAGAPANTAPAKTKADAALEKMRREPLTFFVAKGVLNACGPGCSEWIAVEGNF